MDARQVDAFYDTTLRPKLDALDASRRQLRWLIVKASCVILAPVTYLVAGDLLDGILPFRSSAATVVAGWVWLFGAVIFALVRYLVPGVTAFANYRIRFKQEIVPEIFRAVCPSATYDPLQGITQEVFDASGLFNTRGSYTSDDRVRGRIGDTPFEASEVGRAYSTGSGKSSRSYVVFRGLFFHLDLRRQLSGVTLIAPEKAASHQIGDRDGLDLLTIDHPAFEREFTIHASDESEARALLTPALTETLLALRQQANQPIFLAFKGRRAYVAVHYGRTLFEPGIAKATSRDTVREMAHDFALVELVARDLGRHAPGGDLAPDDSLLEGDGIDVHPLSKLAASKAGTLTSSDLWTLASSEVDDSRDDGSVPVPRPEGTRIRLERGPGSLSVTYGLRLGFWIMLAISLGGALLATSALRAPDAPAWVAPASTWVRATLPPVPPLDTFAADAPTPWFIVGTAVAVLFAWMWTAYVRRVCIDVDRIRIYRGLRPIPRVYARPQFSRVLRLQGAVYITKAGTLRLMNPTASPMLTEAEAEWVASEMKRTLGQA